MSDTVQIPLRGNYTATIDAADLPLVEGFKWYAVIRKRRDGSLYTVYAARSEYLGKIDGRYRARQVKLHQQILGFPDCDIDHKDGDGLNNQRNNLRLATDSQNMGNRRKLNKASSPWKGVYWYPNKQKWHASVSVNGKRKSLGYFVNEADAATAYNFAAAEAFGEFARFNVPKPDVLAVAA